MKYIFAFFVLSVITAAVHAQEPEQWSRFRGPNGQGISTATNLPVKWSADENIAWKTNIPGSGWSSPIVWNDHIFLTSTTNDGKECHLIAVDRKSGKMLWDRIVFTQEPQFKHARNSYATPTPVTDGELVYAVFGSGGFVAADFEGNIVWTKTDLHYYSQHGLGTSPILYNDMLLLAVNPSSKEEPKQLGWQIAWDKSYLLALDKKTGKECWRGTRGMSAIGHSTPAVIQVDGKDQILSAAGNVVQAFDPSAGELIWTVRYVGEPAVPSPAIGDGLVFMATRETNPILAIKPDGKGECTDTNIVWEQKQHSPMTASFLYIKPCLYTATDKGSFAAFEAATGKLLWQKRLGNAINASPVFADGKIYVINASGVATVFKPNDNPTKPAKELAVNEIGDCYVQATLAVAGKQLLLRTENQLWCIGK
jgi:outer membrane protein assembly factor BamB